ncbi:hypothetical protein BGX33_010966, partial [Mortierella sp. NVP41]
IIQKLKVQTPDPYLVNRYLEEIAKTFKVAWSPDPEMDHQLIGSMDGEFIDPINHSVEQPGRPRVQQKPSAKAQPMETDSDRMDLLNDLSSLSESVSKPAVPTKAVPPPTQPSRSVSDDLSTLASPPADDGLPDLDALTRRFEALKKRS